MTSGIKNNFWFILYRRKDFCEYLFKLLRQESVPYYSVSSTGEDSTGEEFVKKEYESIKNLIFIKPFEPVNQFLNKLKTEFGLVLIPYMDCMTGEVAKVGNEEMLRFIKLSKNNPDSIEILKDSFDKFNDKPSVRVKSGPYEGLEGRLVRIRRDRKVVISLGNSAISISGIEFSLLEII